MRIALIGGFDTFVCRGLERPHELLPYRLAPGLNLLRGFKELKVRDIHIVVSTTEVLEPTAEEGPFGVVHRLPRPPFSGSASLFLRHRYLLLSELRNIQPDIVHGQGTEEAYAFTAVTSGYPNVITVHGIMHRVQRVTPPRMLSLDHVPRWIEKFVARKASDVICLNREVEGFFHERRSPARCHLIPNAVAPCFFEAQPQRRPQNGFSLLFVGTIYRLKGLVHLIEALAIVRLKLGVAITLRIIGYTGGGSDAVEYDKFVRRRASELGVADDIEWLGAQGEREVAAALRKTDVLVLPSFQETAPMCIAEAMAAGVPVVASRVGGIPDLVDDAVGGLLVAPGQTAELAEAIAQLLTNESRRVSMGQAAREKAQATYTPRRIAEKTLAVYEAICRDAAMQVHP